MAQNPSGAQTVTLERLAGAVVWPAALRRTVRRRGRRDWRLWLHSALTLGAIMGLAVGTRSVWNSYALTRPGFAVILSFCYVIMLVTGVLALCARSATVLARVDIAVLATAILVKVLTFWTTFTGEYQIRVDEGMLMDRAARALAAGGNPYQMVWPDIEQQSVLVTRLMDGNGVFDFGYPPFGIQLGALFQKLGVPGSGVAVVACLALLATAVVIFSVAPVPLRPLATLGVLGLGLIVNSAQNAYPSVIALPFLCLAVSWWPAIGRGGRLGRGGIIRAVALGLAVSTHQLGWFLAAFLLVGLFLVRRGELGTRASLHVLGRYAAVVAGVFVLINLPYLIGSPGAWLQGITAPMLQHAVPHGQGLMGISYYLLGGSGALDFYGYATTALLLALLVVYAVHLPWLGRAAVVLPWLLFAVSTRSQDGYFLLTMPLWLVALCTTTNNDFDRAYRIPGLSRLSPRVLAMATAAVFLPVLACLTVAVVVPQPLTMRVATVVTPGQVIQSLTVGVINESSRPLAPHFAVSNGVDIGEYWSAAYGPATLAPGEQAVYTLSPPEGAFKPGETPFLRAVSDHPQTLSSVRLWAGPVPGPR